MYAVCPYCSLVSLMEPNMAAIILPAVNILACTMHGYIKLDKKEEFYGYLLNMDDAQRTDRFSISKNVVCILRNSTVWPFRWHLNKYKCFFCPTGFQDFGGIRPHIDTEHRGANLDTMIRHHLKAHRSANVKVDISDITCRLCSQSLPSIEGLTQHLTEVHKLVYDNNVKCVLQAYYLSEMKCSICEEKFEFFQKLLYHMNRHSASWSCDHCGNVFASKALMRQHIINIHATVKKLYRSKCKYCPERFKTQYMRWAHMASAHGVKLEYKCPQCGKEFHIKSRLSKHVSRAHLKEKNFACEVCGDRFFCSYSLKLHMVCHTNERQFECAVCKKQFARKSNLDIHARIHTDDRRCVCKLCGKKFIQTTSLKLHVRVHHPNK